MCFCDGEFMVGLLCLLSWAKTGKVGDRAPWDMLLRLGLKAREKRGSWCPSLLLTGF